MIIIIIIPIIPMIPIIDVMWLLCDYDVVTMRSNKHYQPPMGDPLPFWTRRNWGIWRRRVRDVYRLGSA